MTTSEVTTSRVAGKTGYLFIAGLVLVIDQLTKYWAASELRDSVDKEIIPGFFSLSYTENPGIAFGMLNDGNVRWILVAVSLAATIAVVFYILRTPRTNKLLLWSLALLVAGICGNLIDRVRTGRVIDFLLFYYKDYQWPVFNVADTAITIGAALMAIELFLSPQPDQAAAPLEAESRGIENTGELASKD